MIMVLLCQGLIFETQSDTDIAVLFFGIMTIFMLVSSSVWSVVMVIRRIVSPDKAKLMISRLAFYMLEKDTQEEVFQIYSADVSERTGMLELPKDSPIQRVSNEEMKQVVLIKRQSSQAWDFS
jgi:hypothetical protein